MEKNKGLATSFTLEEGSFKLTSGKEKADDNVLMLFAFMGWFRIFSQDFCVNTFFLFQRNYDYINRYKSSLKLQILQTANKYLPFIKMNSVEFSQKKKGDKSIYMETSFSYNLPMIKQSKKITFVKQI